MLAPWKTASQSLHAVLEKYNESPYPRHFHFNEHLNRVVHQHITFSELASLPEGNLGYKTVAFVRNPYDRCFSGFLQVQRDFEAQPRMNFDPPWIKELVCDQITVNMGRIVRAGFDFNEWISSIPDYEFYEIGRNSNLPLYPAHYWTNRVGRKVDFIGKVEEISNDFVSLCDFLGINREGLIESNASRAGEHSYLFYSRYAGRMSAKSIEKINNIFSKDFDYFDYEKVVPK